MILYSSPRFAEHVTPPGHPEGPERAAVFDAAADAFRRQGGEVRTPNPASLADLALVHTREYLDRLQATAGRAVRLDPDTFTSPESFDIALLAAGASVDAARAAWDARTAACALVRPPGHHAEADRAMGFCLLNNIAVAAAVLRRQGARRLAIVDIDVHHGNGTQAIFYADPTVLYVSSHQSPYYPGTGAAEETGAGPGTGFTLNVPLPAGATDDEYAGAYEAVVIPALDRFAPEALLVSAGFDAHALDPLAGMRLTTGGYAHLVGLIRQAGDRLCQGRTAWMTEGGYHPVALRECLDAMFAVLS